MPPDGPRRRVMAAVVRVVLVVVGLATITDRQGAGQALTSFFSVAWCS